MPAVRLFETPLGRMAVAATDRGVVRVALPGCRADVAAIERVGDAHPRGPDGPRTRRASPAAKCPRLDVSSRPDKPAGPHALPSTDAAAEAVARQAERELTEYLAGRRRTFTVPVDLDAAPAFHRAVYRALRRVPFGRTVTYGALARRAGSPGAARAVGRAMARNPVPLVVPCHRVVASAGPGGFGGGLDLKRRLLALEGVAM